MPCIGGLREGVVAAGAAGNESVSRSPISAIDHDFSLATAVVSSLDMVTRRSKTSELLCQHLQMDKIIID